MFFQNSNLICLYTPTLRRTAPIVRNWRHVANQFDFNSCSLNCANCRFAPRAWPFDTHFAATHTAVARNSSSFIRRLLRRKWCPFARTAESHSSRGTLCYQISLKVGNAYQRVIESRLNVDNALRNDFLFFLFENFLFACGLLLLCHRSVLSLGRGGIFHKGYRQCPDSYFLPATFFFATVARRGPFRVRAFVWVRCPLTGKLRRCLRPR